MYVHDRQVSNGACPVLPVAAHALQQQQHLRVQSGGWARGGHQRAVSAGQRHLTAKHVQRNGEHWLRGGRRRKRTFYVVLSALAACLSCCEINASELPHTSMLKEGTWGFLHPILVLQHSQAPQHLPRGVLVLHPLPAGGYFIRVKVLF